MLIVTAGSGLVQSEGGPVRELRPGDVVLCPPQEKHWHGATRTTAMTHIAVQELLDGKAVEWMEKNQPRNADLIRFRAEAATLIDSGHATSHDDKNERSLLFSPSDR